MKPQPVAQTHSTATLARQLPLAPLGLTNECAGSLLSPREDERGAEDPGNRLCPSGQGIPEIWDLRCT